MIKSLKNLFKANKKIYMLQIIKKLKEYFTKLDLHFVSNIFIIQ